LAWIHQLLEHSHFLTGRLDRPKECHSLGGNIQVGRNDPSSSPGCLGLFEPQGQQKEMSSTLGGTKIIGSHNNNTPPPATETWRRSTPAGQNAIAPVWSIGFDLHSDLRGGHIELGGDTARRENAVLFPEPVSS
jgi:hypothetical protein